MCLHFSYSYDITGFPTIKYFPADNKDGEDVGCHVLTLYSYLLTLFANTPKHFSTEKTKCVG